MALWWRLIRPWSQNVMGLLAVCPCQCYLAFLYLRTILAITNLSAKYGLSCALPFQTRWSLFLGSGTALCLKHILSPSPWPAASLLSVHLAHTLRSVVHPPPHDLRNIHSNQLTPQRQLPYSLWTVSLRQSVRLQAYCQQGFAISLNNIHLGCRLYQHIGHCLAFVLFVYFVLFVLNCHMGEGFFKACHETSKL